MTKTSSFTNREILESSPSPAPLRAGAEGGRFLTLWTPGGLEAMFVELSRLPADSLREPEVRRLMSMRFDSIPV